MGRNSMGSSQYTRSISVTTKSAKQELESADLHKYSASDKFDHRMPRLENAQLDDIREAVCFDLIQNGNNDNRFLSKDVVIRLDIESSVMAMIPEQQQRHENEEESSSNSFMMMSRDMRRSLAKTSSSENEKMNYFLPQHRVFKLSNSLKFKYGQNCVSFGRLVELDHRLQQQQEQ